MEKVFDSVLKTIGKTPMVQLDRLKAEWKLEGTLLAKLENLNPGSSKKDRIALRMIEEAESSGELEPGQPVVELTSGNTGTGYHSLRRQGLPLYSRHVQGQFHGKGADDESLRSRSNPSGPSGGIAAWSGFRTGP